MYKELYCWWLWLRLDTEWRTKGAALRTPLWITLKCVRYSCQTLYLTWDVIHRRYFCTSHAQHSHCLVVENTRRSDSLHKGTSKILREFKIKCINVRLHRTWPTRRSQNATSLTTLAKELKSVTIFAGGCLTSLRQDLCWKTGLFWASDWVTKNIDANKLPVPFPPWLRSGVPERQKGKGGQLFQRALLILYVQSFLLTL